MWHSRLVCIKPPSPFRCVPSIRTVLSRVPVKSCNPATTPTHSGLHSSTNIPVAVRRTVCIHSCHNALTAPSSSLLLPRSPLQPQQQLSWRTFSSSDTSSTSKSHSSDAPNHEPNPSSVTPVPPIPTVATELSWLVRHCPPSLLPYLQLARVDKPVGTWLLLMPCYWGIALATPAGSLPDLYLLSLMGIGAFVMRGAGCTINDLWDRDFDKQVARTKTRPLAAGTVTVPQALGFLTGQLAVGLAVVLQLDLFTIGVAMASMPLVIAYPLMKRFTHWPQFVLGLTFNWGIWVGYSSVCHTIDSIALLPMYAASVCWTLVYDSIYAHQDIEDDKKIGVKSTAIAFGDHSKTWLSTFGIATMTGLAAVAPLADLGLIYQTIAIGGGSMHMLYQLMTVDLKDGGSCHRTFVSNVKFAWIIFLGIVLDRLFAEKKKHSVQLPNTKAALLVQ